MLVLPELTSLPVRATHWEPPPTTTKIGVNDYEVGHQDIETLPQGSNAPLDKVLLQAPGVTMDSAASGSLHVRNEAKRLCQHRRASIFHASEHRHLP
jgi:hypothetical protein